MQSFAVFLIALTASCIDAIPTQPLSGAIPSVHPLTGPVPPLAASVPHGKPRTWTAQTSAGAAASLKSQTPGKYWSGWSGVQKYFAFGDSYSQTGFEPNLTQPSAAFPLGNPQYPGYTSSNGPNYIDYLTTTYNESLVETYNLAYGGATVDADLVKPYEPTVLSFIDQVNTEFFPYYVDVNNSQWTSANSLFSFFFGINDVGNSYYLQNATLNGDIIDVYAGLVDDLYNAGARNLLFLNVPPVDKSPLITEQGSAAESLEAADITDFNNRISQMAANFSTYDGTTVFTFDTNGLFNQVLQNPASYQQTSIYKNTTGYCVAYENGTSDEDSFDPSCGVPVNEYFWLNTLHPTYPMHDVLAQQIAKQLEG